MEKNERKMVNAFILLLGVCLGAANTSAVSYLNQTPSPLWIVIYHLGLGLLVGGLLIGRKLSSHQDGG